MEVDPLNSAEQGPESVEDGSIESVPVEDVEPPLEDLSEVIGIRRRIHSIHKCVPFFSLHVFRIFLVYFSFG